MTEKGKLSQRNRSRQDIHEDILRNCLEGSKQTWIMYRCNLSMAQLRTYIDELEGGNMIEQRISETKKVEYITTPKGRRYLDQLETTNAMLPLKQ